MEEMLARAMKVAEEAEVFAFSAEETHVQFEANRLKHLQTKQQTNVALRLIMGGKIGYATTTRRDVRQDLVNNALETAQFGIPAKFKLPSMDSHPQIEVFDPAVASVSNRTMIELGEELITAVTQHTPGIVCEAVMTKGIVSIRMMNSRGGQADYQKSLFSLGIEGTLINDTDMLFVGESERSCHPLLESKTVAEVVRQQLELARDRARVSNKSLPVVFTPHGVASTLLPSLAAGFNGKVVVQGASPLRNKLGQVVFDPKLWLWDDPTLAYRPNSRPCDDEGIPSQRTSLVEQGRVTNFIYDLQTAASAGTQSTGNASREHGGLPVPAPSAFIIAPGNTTFAEMVQAMKEGLVIEHLMGAEQTNILSGDFSGNVLLGYKVENGKMVGRVKDTMVGGNIYQLLKDIIAIGNEPKWVGSLLQTPHLYFPSLSVVSK